METNPGIDVFTSQYYAQTYSVQSSDFILPDFPIQPDTVTAPVGGRLSYFLPNYLQFCKSDFVLNIIKFGYRIKFNSPPPLTIHPKPFELKLPDTQQAILDKELQEFLNNNVIELADISTPGFYSPVFLREKPRHNLQDPIKYRVIIDLSLLNTYVTKMHFKMESTKSIRSTLQVGDFFFSLDLTMAYNTIPMAATSKKYLRFWWNGVAYQFRALCFGLSSAPWLFSTVMAEMAKYFHIHSIGSMFYLDDLLFRDLLYRRLLLHQPKIIFFVQACGWVVNFDKSALDILQRGVYVGTDFDLLHGLVFPPLDRWQKLQLKINRFLVLDQATGHLWSSLLGTITSCQDLTPLGRLMARPLQIHLNKHWLDRKDPHCIIPVSPQVKQDLLWWTEYKNVMCGAPLRPPPPDLEMWSDASLIGHGATLLGQDFSGTWSPAMARNHINYLEMLSLKLALEHFEHIVTNQCVLAHVDNQTVVCYVNKLSGSRSPKLHTLCQEMLLWCHNHQVILRAAHIKGKLNTHTDYLSRKGSIVHTEWSIHPSVIQQIKATWINPPNIDLFASHLNHKFPLYMSAAPDPCAVAQDALTQSWDGLTAYAFPPIAIIPQILNKVAQHQCVLFLVAPNWPRMSWFSRLLDLLVDIPRTVPDLPKLLHQPGTHIFHQNPQCYSLHVFRLCRDASEQETFLNLLRSPLVKRTDSLQTTAMNVTGKDICIGYKRGLAIPSWPL